MTSGPAPAARADRPPDTEPPSRPARSRLAVLSSLAASVGPLAATLTTYGLLLDHLEPDWFRFALLRYLFAAVCALSVWLALYLLGRVLLDRFGPPTGTASQVPAATVGGPVRPTVHQLLARTRESLVADFRAVDKDGTRVAGWSQYLQDDVEPSAIGTSYGLRLAADLDLRDHRFDPRQVAEGLLALEKPGGGWAASTQRGIGRPEVTAWVAGPMARVGLDPAVRQRLVALLERLAVEPDPVGANRTVVVTTLVSTLAEIAPGSPRLPELVERLLDGAVSADQDGAAVAWGETLRGRGRRSVPHTARAVVALARAVPVLREVPGLPGHGAAAAALAAGVEWLDRDGLDLTSTDEQIRRPVAGGEVDALFVGHFTAAWVARALMAVDPGPGTSRALGTAVRRVLAEQRDGVWRWHDSSRPIWMTYQGVTVLRAYALRNLEWPP